MSTSTEGKSNLEAMTVSALQKLFSQEIGREPRSSDKRHLIRKITEARERVAGATAVPEPRAAEAPAAAAPDQAPVLEEASTSSIEAPADGPAAPAAQAASEASSSEPDQTSGSAPSEEAGETAAESAAGAGTESVEPTTDDAGRQAPSPGSAIGEAGPPATSEASAEGGATTEGATSHAGAETESSAGDLDMATVSADLPNTHMPTRGQFEGKSVRQLQSMYLEVVGRKTSSTNAAYLKWKIGAAQNGRVPVGPTLPRGEGAKRGVRKETKTARSIAKKTRRASAKDDVMILPLRMDAGLVEELDRFWKGKKIRSRMGFFRKASAFYLARHGAPKLAAKIEAPAES